jgi:hypothetical protein
MLFGLAGLPVRYGHSNGQSAPAAQGGPRQLASGESAFRANSSPAVPTKSITLRDDGHGIDVWPPSATR